MTDSATSEDLQRRMASLVAELRGVMNQINETTPASNAPRPAAPVVAATTTATPQPALEEPFGVLGFTVTNPNSDDGARSTTLDQDLAQLFSADASSADSAGDMMQNIMTAMQNGTMPPEVMQQFMAQYGGGYRGGRGRGRYGGYSRGSFPPPGAHVTNAYYDSNSYYGDMDPQMMAVMIFQQMMYEQQQRSYYRGGRGRGAIRGGMMHDGKPQSPTTFSPNVDARPYQPPSQSPLIELNARIMREAFPTHAQMKEVPNPPKAEDSEEEVHTASGAAAPRKRKARKGVQAAMVQDCDDAKSPMAYVEFKRQKVKKYPCAGVIQPGQYVIVDGDRGLDMGLLVQMTAPGTDGQLHVVTMESSAVEDLKMKPERGRVLRVASAQDIEKLHNELCTAEKNALKQCRQRCQELKLSIEVLDCEYQFDLKKVSFYFNSDKSVDFRELVRDLYKSFGARIWMENINPNVKNVVPHGSRHH